MPLSFGMRDEESERINNKLKKLMTLVFVPDEWNEGDVDIQLKSLGIDTETLVNITDVELVSFVVKCHFDWENMEQFADFLAALSQKPAYVLLKSKALALYNYIQAESKMFSFDIMNKINALR